MSSTDGDPLAVLDFEARLAAEGSGLAAWAASGGMSLTGAPHGSPHARGAGAAVATSTALDLVAELGYQRTGRLPVLPTAALLGERAAIAGLTRNAPWSAGGSTRSVRGVDGWWMLSLARETDRASLDALTETTVTEDGWLAVDRWAATTPASDAVARAQLLGLAASVVPETPASPDQQRADRTTATTLTTRGGARRSVTRPRVIDLTSLWAGPLCASLLGVSGCEIVKVESTRRLDGARGGPALFYDLLHAGHHSVTIDFASAKGRDQLLTLIAGADLVLEASRPRALAQLGVDAAEVVANGTTWVSITAYGRTGPWANRIGFGDDAAVAGGLHTVIGDRPAPCGDAIADPLTGVYAAAAANAALLQPEAYLLDIAMREVAALAARVPVEPCQVRGSELAGWEVEWAGGRVPVAPPSCRRAPRRAGNPGADNETILGAAGGGSPC